MVTLRLYDTATHAVRDFVPLTEGRAGIYVCGATPQSAPHIGHLRAAVSFDVLRRWLTRTGYQVTYVRNVTDIDDKILVRSAEAGRPWWAHAYEFEQAFDAAYDTLNALRPSYAPRATGHATEMVELIGRLVDAGHAYPAPDGSGDVYFDVRSWPSYGELTHQRVEDMEPAADADPSAKKRDPRDFALWKGAKAGEPATASWPTPWGRGRPGWHLECSAMATRYLGATFDIHGGGLDLRFPHHENEIAQSRAAGDGFARYWLHNGWVVQGGEKMSKSLGNVMALDVLVEQVPPAVIRYLLAVPHYRSNIEVVVPDSLTEAATAYERIENFVTRAAEVFAGALTDADPTTVELPEAYVRAMDDDLGTPAALAVMHETVRAGNTALAAGDDAALPLALRVRAMADVLGIDPLDPHWLTAAGGRGHDPARAALDALVRAELDARAAARKRPGLRDRGCHPRPARGGRDRGRGHPRRGEMDPADAGAHPGRGELMAGNSSRRGAVRKGASKKGATAGSGGRNRRGLQGRGPTPKAVERTGHPAARAGAAARRTAQAAQDGPSERGAGAGDRSRGGARRPGPRTTGRSGSRSTGATEYVAGRNPVVEALRADVPAKALYLAARIEHDARIKEALKAANDRRVPLLEVTRTDLDRMTDGAIHQGVALAVPPYDYAHPGDLIATAREAGQVPLIVALDGVTDPRNLGAVVRSVAAFGGHGVVVPERRSAGMTAGAWKTSAGAAVRVRVARAANLTRALQEYSRAGCFIAGLDADGDLDLPALEAATEPLVIVVGSEGKGLSRLVRQTCDVVVSIPMAGGTESLNAGVAAGVALYEVARRRSATHS